jgi:hypothetical protein
MGCRKGRPEPSLSSADRVGRMRGRRRPRLAVVVGNRCGSWARHDAGIARPVARDERRCSKSRMFRLGRPPIITTVDRYVRIRCLRCGATRLKQAADRAARECPRCQCLSWEQASCLPERERRLLRVTPAGNSSSASFAHAYELLERGPPTRNALPPAARSRSITNAIRTRPRARSRGPLLHGQG